MFFQPFTHGFPRANIHELITPDILHQLIKGTFKDHLVTWVEEHLVLKHGRAHALQIIQDIDRRCV
jgi:Plavaka transposase